MFSDFEITNKYCLFLKFCYVKLVMSPIKVLIKHRQPFISYSFFILYSVFINVFEDKRTVKTVNYV